MSDTKKLHVSKTHSLIFLLFCCTVGALAAGQQRELVYENADALPEVTVGGAPAVIHTQGLYVTDQHYLVTGRLETKPKRALLLRFSRDDLRKYEVADITPPPVDGAVLDHPGGFDVDSQGRFWIPLSTSNPQGPSLICRYTIDSNAALIPGNPEALIQIDDHIGAICLLKDDSLVGASWDTKDVYLWSADGSLLTSFRGAGMFGGDRRKSVAVQDWKSLDPNNNHIILGGLDKSREPSRAIIEVGDIIRGELLETHELPRREDVSRPLTNEGLAVHRGKLYLLPEDIGRGAKVLRFRFEARTDD